MKRAPDVVVANAQETLRQTLTEQHRKALANLGSLAASQLQEVWRSQAAKNDSFRQALNRAAAPLGQILSSNLAGSGAMNEFFDTQRKQIAEMVEAMRRGLEGSLPPNWRAAGIDLPDNLDELLLDEGLPLAWVPPEEVLVRLIEAKDAAERRKIIGSNWKKITKACLVELDDTSATELTEYTEFARLAADALLAGHHQASQALSANTLDTIIRREFDEKSRGNMTSRKTRVDIEEYPLKPALVLGGIWGAHAEFWPHKGDKIPRNYSRHGTAHGVSRRQYSRINAILALMHLVSLIRFIESEFI